MSACILPYSLISLLFHSIQAIDKSLVSFISVSGGGVTGVDARPIDVPVGICEMRGGRVRAIRQQSLDIRYVVVQL